MKGFPRGWVHRKLCANDRDEGEPVVREPSTTVMSIAAARVIGSLPDIQHPGGSFWGVASLLLNLSLEPPGTGLASLSLLQPQSVSDARGDFSEHGLDSLPGSGGGR